MSQGCRAHALPCIRAAVPVSVVLAAVLLLASCGGGSGGSGDGAPGAVVGMSTTLSGIAAVGSPLTSAAIFLNCSGANASTTTDATGLWQAVVPTASLPCLVRATGGAVGVGGTLNTRDLYSFGGAMGSTTINVTPVTTLVLGRAAYVATGTADLANVFSTTQTAGTLTALSGKVATETTTLASALMTAGYAWPTGAFNPFSTAFVPTAGDSYDDLIAHLVATLNDQRVAFDTLLYGYATGTQSIPVPTPAGSAGWGALSLMFDRGAYGSFETTSIKFDKNGNGVAVWSTSQTIWANRYTADAGWGEAVQISPASSHSAYAAFVSLDKEGNALVIWRDEDGYGDQSVWANRYAIGSGWGIATRLTDAGGRYNIDVSNVSVSYFNNGTPLIVWGQFDNTGRSVLHCIYSIATGACRDPAVTLATNAEEPSIANDEAGNIVIAWHKLEYSSGSIWAIQYQPGVGWSGRFLVKDRISTGQLRYPLVTFCGESMGYIEWSEIPFGTYTESVFSLGFEFDDFGFGTYDYAALVGSERTECFHDGQQVDFSIWKIDDSARLSQSVWVNRAASDTRYQWGAAQKLSADRVTIYTQNIVHDGKGNALAMWLEYDGYNTNLMYAKYTDGVGWSIAAPVPESGHPENFSLVLDPLTGDAVSTWTKGARIYVRRFGM